MMMFCSLSSIKSSLKKKKEKKRGQYGKEDYITVLEYFVSQTQAKHLVLFARKQIDNMLLLKFKSEIQLSNEFTRCHRVYSRGCSLGITAALSGLRVLLRTSEEPAPTCWKPGALEQSRLIHFKNGSGAL